MNSNQQENHNSGKVPTLMIRQNELDFKVLGASFWLSLPARLLAQPSTLEKIIFQYRDLGVEGLFLQIDIDEIAQISLAQWQSLNTWLQVGPFPVVLKIGTFLQNSLWDIFTKPASSQHLSHVELLNSTSTQRSRELSQYLEKLWSLHQTLKFSGLPLHHWLLVHEGLEYGVQQKLEPLLTALDPNYWNQRLNLVKQTHKFWQELLLAFNQRLYAEAAGNSPANELAPQPLTFFIFEQNEFCKKIPLGLDVGQIFFPAQSHFNQSIFPDLLTHQGIFDLQHPIDYGGQFATPMCDTETIFEFAAQQLQNFMSLYHAKRKHSGTLTHTISLLSQYPFAKAPVTNAIAGTGSTETILDISSALFKFTANPVYKHELKPSLLHELDQVLHQNGYSTRISTMAETARYSFQSKQHLDIICEVFKDWSNLESALQLFVSSKQPKVFLVSESFFQKDKYKILGFFKAIEYSEIILEEGHTLLFFENWIDKELPCYSVLVLPDNVAMEHAFTQDTVDRLLRFHQIKTQLRCSNPLLDFVSDIFHQAEETLVYGYVRNSTSNDQQCKFTDLSQKVLWQAEILPFETQFFEFKI